MGACNCISRETGKNEPDLNTEKYRNLGNDDINFVNF